MSRSKNEKHICTSVEDVRAAFNDISIFRTEDTRFMSQALLFLCERNMSATKPVAQSPEEYEQAIDIANSVENENDLNDGGYFEAGFIAAKTKIIDALIAARDGQDTPSAKQRLGESQ